MYIYVYTCFRFLASARCFFATQELVQVKELMLDELRSQDDASAVACRWLQRHESIWEKWLPDATKCFSHFGLYNEISKRFVPGDLHLPIFLIMVSHQKLRDLFQCCRFQYQHLGHFPVPMMRSTTALTLADWAAEPVNLVPFPWNCTMIKA